jgi:hypothetical protein
MKFPLHHKIGLTLLEQTGPLYNISASYHVFLTYRFSFIERIKDLTDFVYALIQNARASAFAF